MPVTPVSSQELSQIPVNTNDPPLNSGYSTRAGRLACDNRKYVGGEWMN